MGRLEEAISGATNTFVGGGRVCRYIASADRKEWALLCMLSKDLAAVTLCVGIDGDVVLMSTHRVDES